MRTKLSRRRGRALAAFTATIVASSVLAGCGSGGPAGAGGDGKTLNVWTYQDALSTVQEEQVKRFNEKSDVKVKLTQVPGDAYQDKMRTAMGTPNAPDVFFNWGGGSIANFVEKDMLVDLTAEFEKEGLKDAFIPSVVDSGKVGDKIYGVPMRGMQPVLLFTNDKVFEEAGAEKPKTWDDLLNLIDTFKEQGVTPFALAGADGWPELMWVEYILDRLGGAEVFKRAQNGDAGAWGDPAVLKTAQTVEDLVDRGAFGKNYASVNYTEDGASTLFAKDKAAMHLMGSWEYGNQQTNQPKFAKENLGYTTFPPMPGGKGDVKNVVGNPTNYWSINKKAENREAALEFVKMSAESWYAEELVGVGDVPTTTNAEDVLGSHTNQEYAEFQYDLVKEAPDFTLSWDQALPVQQAEPTITNIQKLFNGQLTAEQFVDAMKGL